METNDLAMILEEHGLDQNKISEIISTLPANPDAPAADRKVEVDLKMQLLNETDWKKRAAIAARILSDSIDA